VQLAGAELSIGAFLELSALIAAEFEAFGNASTLGIPTLPSIGCMRPFPTPTHSTAPHRTARVCAQEPTRAPLARPLALASQPAASEWARPACPAEQAGAVPGETPFGQRRCRASVCGQCRAFSCGQCRACVARSAVYQGFEAGLSLQYYTEAAMMPGTGRDAACSAGALLGLCWALLGSAGLCWAASSARAATAYVRTGQSGLVLTA
jgi:hypothetical protein